MTDSTTGRPAAGVAAALSNSLAGLWTRYTGRRPSDPRIEVRGNVVTWQATDAVADYDHGLLTSRKGDLDGVNGILTDASYRRDAISAVVGITHQRVSSMISSHDRETDVATEVFTLEPSFWPAPREVANRSRGQL